MRILNSIIAAIALTFIFVANVAAQSIGSVTTTSGKNWTTVYAPDINDDLSKIYATPFVTLSAQTGFTNERALAAGALLGLSDGGAGGNLTVSVTDVETTCIAGLTSAADKVPYFTGSGTCALADLSSAFRTFLTTSSSANLRSVMTDETGTGAAMFGLTTSMSDDLGCTGNQIVRRNAGDTAFECATGAAGLTSADIDTSAELRAIMTDEIGTGVLFFLGAPAGDDQAFVSTSTSAGAWGTIPDSDGATQKLQYDQATNTFIAGTDDDVPDAADYSNLTGGTGITNSPTGTINFDGTELTSVTLGSSNFTDLIFSGAGAIDITLNGATSNELSLTQSDAGAAGPQEVLFANSASPAASDIVSAIISRGKDSAANNQDYGRVNVTIDDATSTSEDSTMRLAVVTAGTFANELDIRGDALFPEANDGLALGTSSLMFSDLFLASGGVINFNNGNMTITHSAGALTVAGGSVNIGNNALTVGTLELANGTANTLSASGGTLSIEGVALATAASVTAKTESFCVAASDEVTPLTTGTAKVTFRMPYAFTVTGIRGSLSTVATGASLLTVDVNEAGVTIISTKLTFDASEKTTTTAATPPVISDSSLADDAEMTIDIDQVGNTTPGKGLKVCIIGHQ